MTEKIQNIIRGNDKMKKLILFFAIAIVVASCSPGERVVDNTNSNWDLLAASAEDNSLQLIEMPDGEVKVPDILAAFDEVNLNSPITKLRRYQSQIYAIVPEDFKIIIINEYDYSLTAVIDFSELNLKPSEIVFANATSAYVTHPESNLISLVDITDAPQLKAYKIARQIPVGRGPTDIAVSGNQMLVTNSLDNTVSIVDTRTNKEEATLPTFPVPYIVEFVPNSSKAVVLSKGNGKIDDLEESAAYIQYFDVETRQMSDESSLAVASMTAVEANPIDLVITPDEWGFIITNKLMVRADIRSRKNFSVIRFEKFHYIDYNLRLNRVIAIFENDRQETELHINDPVSGSTKDRYYLPKSINAVLIF